MFIVSNDREYTLIKEGLSEKEIEVVLKHSRRLRELRARDQSLEEEEGGSDDCDPHADTGSNSTR